MAQKRRGGSRLGAGRPRSGRRQRQYRATEAEHRLVRAFILEMRKNFDKAQEAVENLRGLRN